MLLKKSFLFFIFILIAIAAIIFLVLPRFKQKSIQPFSGDSAYQFVEDQMQYGPRTPGSLAHKLIQEYMIQKLKDYGWQVESQKLTIEGHEITNIIGKRGNSGEISIIGAHYDSRLVASEETSLTLQTLPVPGANDGASGVAVLLELARTMPEIPNRQIWLVFLDAEDQGRITGWDWILGSKAFVQNLVVKPSKVVILDMIGDSDLTVYREQGSDPDLTDQVWQSAADLGYSNNFVNKIKYSILDDHLPFIEAGIPAVDIIDFDYPWWHTTSDTADKVSPQSLEIIGKTILHWLESNP
jgi:glutaminyl-peptide cyclotransferase